MVKTRKQLKETSTAAIIIKQPFYMFNLLPNYKDPYKHTKVLLILKGINDYNRYIGSVNIVD